VACSAAARRLTSLRPDRPLSRLPASGPGFGVAARAAYDPRMPPNLFDGLRAAIIDLDGTLVDTLADFDHALNATLSDMGLGAIARERIGRMVGKGSEHLIRSALEAVGASQDRYAHAWEAYQGHYQAVNGRHAALFPGAIEGLRGLAARGLRLACVTNKPGRFARSLLEAKGVDGYFEQVFGGDAFEHCKPHPMPLLRACQALDASPQATLVVGDSSNDALAARAAGCPVVLVTYGYNHGQPVRELDADGFVDSLAQLA
jgi:phosphoglycolate phosphatase